MRTLMFYHFRTLVGKNVLPVETNVRYLAVAPYIRKNLCMEIVARLIAGSIADRTDAVVVDLSRNAFYTFSISIGLSH
uniref:THUMP domain-containing protein n=1 Tax=Steinernema glaseri TaxID=37863 RepID=A0A1I8ALC0_9BILA